MSTEDMDVDIETDLTPVGARGTRLMRRAGTHREPRMYDWRRRAGRRSTVTGFGPKSRTRRGLAVLAVAVAATLVVGGTHFLLAAAKANPKSAAAALPSLGSAAATSPSGVVQVTDSPTPSSSATSAGPTTSAPGATTVTTQAPAAGQTTTSGRTTAPTTTNSTTPAKTTTTPAKTTTTPAKTTAPTKKPTEKPSAAPSTTTPAVVPVTGTGTVVGIAGQCLDVDNAQAGNGTRVEIFACNGTNAQLWTAQGGTLKAYGKCLTRTDGAGSRLVLRDCDGSDNQSWQLVSRTIVNATSNLCVDVDGGSSADLTPTIAATCNGTPTQAWTLT